MKHCFKNFKFLVLLFISQSLFAQNTDFQKIDSVFATYTKPNETGSALAIIKNGKTIYERYEGLANVEHNIAISDSTVFNIASLSKQFTSFLALLLQDEGKLSFSDDIRFYLPELKHLPYKITIKQLTNHTHGLANVDELALLKGIETMSHQEVVTMLLNIEQPNFRSGDNYVYNNTGYVLLSEIIERVGKKPFKVQLEERIFTPLGMKNAQVINDHSTVIKNKAYSYLKNKTVYTNFPVKITTIGSSGIYSTLSDLTLWVKNHQHITLGKPSFFKKMQDTTVLNSGKRINYGSGLQFKTYKGIDVVFHGGGTEAYRSYILHAPEHNLSFVFLSNNGGFEGLDIVYQSLENLLKDHIKPEQALAPEHSMADLENFEGTYEVHPGTYYTIIAEKGKLYFQEFGQKGKEELPAIAINAFDFPFLPHSKFVFSKDKFNFHIADFTYPSKKITIKLPEQKNIDLNDFVGVYENKAHDTSYELVIANNQLVAKHHTLPYDICLNPISKASFYSNAGFFGKLDFTFDSMGNTNGFKVSGQNLKNFVFKKIK